LGAAIAEPAHVIAEKSAHTTIAAGAARLVPIFMEQVDDGRRTVRNLSAAIAERSRSAARLRSFRVSARACRAGTLAAAVLGAGHHEIDEALAGGAVDPLPEADEA